MDVGVSIEFHQADGPHFLISKVGQQYQAVKGVCSTNPSEEKGEGLLHVKRENCSYHGGKATQWG